MEIAVLTLVVDDVGETEQKTLKIDYEGSVNNIMSDVNTKSLIVSITAPDSGTLNITLPREIIDSRVVDRDIDGSIMCDGIKCDDTTCDSMVDSIIDDIFYIVIDGEEVQYTETVTTEHRTLEIPYIIGSEVIEIIGTTVIEDLHSIGDGIAIATMIGI